MSGRIVFSWGEKIGNTSRNVEEGISPQERIDDVVLTEYIKVVENEYNAERNKKNSFETRAGILLTFLGAIIVFLMEKIHLLNTAFRFTAEECSCLLNLKSLIGLLVYVFLGLAIHKLIELISVRPHDSFDVSEIDEELLTNNKLEALCKLMFTYRDIVVSFRKQNEQRASALKFALYCVFSTLVCAVFYVNIIL